MLHLAQLCVLIIVVALNFCACSRQLPAASAARSVAELIEQYGNNSDLSANSYLSDILQRLIPNNQATYQIVILPTDTILALSPEPGVITLSRGLLLNLNSEAELAFVLAHEIAHQNLNHLQSTRPQIVLEREADSMATRELIRSGYDAKAAISALISCYNAIHYFSEKARSTGPTDPFNRYPSLAERVAVVEQTIRFIGTSTVGTRNRRAFITFQQDLRS